ncbi:MAG: RibD family protein [Proteobacteria bacterium]|nr:RibD family protein [Pseudomonadota bacterium]
MGSLHHYFYHRLSGGQPFFGAKWAQSLDGRLASPSGVSQWISSPESLVYSQWLRYMYDGVMVGSQTFITDKPSLSLRHPFFMVNHEQPVKIIFDPRLRALKHPCFFDHFAHLAKDDAHILWLGSEELKGSVNQLGVRYQNFFNNVSRDRCHFLFELDPQDTVASLISLLSSPQLSVTLGRTMFSFLVEGGPRLHSLLLGEGCYQAIHMVTCPKWLGGQHEVCPDGRVLPHDLNTLGPYGLITSHTFGEDVLCEYFARTLPWSSP